MTPECTITVRKPTDVIAVAPYVIGFHPTDSVVVIGVDADTVAFGVRYDLPLPGEDDAEMALIVARQCVQHVVVLGYGPPGRVTPAIVGLARRLARMGVVVSDAIWITGGRWRSVFCTNPACCPAEGNPCPTADSVGVAEAVFGGLAALPDRKALVAQVSPVEGEERAAMRTATESAEKRLDDLEAGDRSVLRAGRAAVREAERAVRSGRELTGEEVAWLGVLLLDSRVLDYGLDRSAGDPWRVRLWTGVLRRVESDFVAAPACLLAYAAWQQGDGALARVAIDRGLRADPGHDTTGVIDRLLRSGLGPSALVALTPPGGRRRPAAVPHRSGRARPFRPGPAESARAEAEGLGIERPRREAEPGGGPLTDREPEADGVEAGGRRRTERRTEAGGRIRARREGEPSDLRQSGREPEAGGSKRTGRESRKRAERDAEPDDRRERRPGRARGTGDGRRQSRSTRRRSL